MPTFAGTDSPTTVLPTSRPTQQPVVPGPIPENSGDNDKEALLLSYSDIVIVVVVGVGLCIGTILICNMRANEKKENVKLHASPHPVPNAQDSIPVRARKKKTIRVLVKRRRRKKVAGVTDLEMGTLRPTPDFDAIKTSDVEGGTQNSSNRGDDVDSGREAGNDADSDDSFELSSESETSSSADNDDSFEVSSKRETSSSADSEGGFELSDESETSSGGRSQENC